MRFIATKIFNNGDMTVYLPGEHSIRYNDGILHSYTILSASRVFCLFTPFPWVKSINFFINLEVYS